ncbi:DNA replication complex GINS protein PSF1 [Verruconis gallopava]|uniref:DNA replication complex GINS protein PSF1 n=1 Tax=Verruconis gallopava TaxID=253628 RepID=A0A0D2AI74_9PEZI|nr:DNA replication complex GINS protein PSF1 [Verruconis gallopava]KIW06553.1 DNA replication complex GINS protein PSF1 [Verruconis gallopava]
MVAPRHDPKTRCIFSPFGHNRQKQRSSMYGDAANKLVTNAKRAEALPTIPPYSTDLVRTILREIQHLDASVSSVLASYGGSFNPQSDPATATRLLVEYMCMRRDKRCLLAYHRARCVKIEEEIWAGKDVLGGGNGGVDGNEGGLSPEEEEYARQYTELLAAYKGKWTDIDLTGSLEPPKDLFVDVRVLKDAGEIQTEYGAITLSKNSQFYVRQGDVERLIQQGYLQKLS